MLPLKLSIAANALSGNDLEVLATAADYLELRTCSPKFCDWLASVVTVVRKLRADSARVQFPLPNPDAFDDEDVARALTAAVKLQEQLASAASVLFATACVSLFAYFASERLAQKQSEAV